MFYIYSIVCYSYRSLWKYHKIRKTINIRDNTYTYFFIARIHYKKHNVRIHCFVCLSITTIPLQNRIKLFKSKLKYNSFLDIFLQVFPNAFACFKTSNASGNYMNTFIAWFAWCCKKVHHIAFIMFSGIKHFCLHYIFALQGFRYITRFALHLFLYG